MTRERRGERTSLLALSLNKACGVKEYLTMHCFVIPLHTQAMREQEEID